MTLQALFSKKHRRFLKQQAPGQSTSLSHLAWHRFCRNRLSVASLVVIGLFVLVAILGYLVTPDHTPYCNQQYLELATLHPGSKATFLCLNDSTLATLLHTPET